MKQLGEAFDLKLQQALASLEQFDTPPEIIPACDWCNDLGSVRVAGQKPGDPYFGKLVPCPNPECIRGNEHRTRIWNGRYASARIPDHYQELTFATWQILPDEYKAKKGIASWAAYLFADKPDRFMTRFDIFEAAGVIDPDAGLPDRKKNCVMLYGGVGLGKTGLMAAAANKLIADGRSLLYIREIDLIAEIQKHYGRIEYPTAESVEGDFKTAPLLFLDEIGDESAYPDRLRRIETIIEHRRAMYLPTFMTTNLNQIEFRRAWGDRTADRVINMAHWIICEGLKLRKTEKPIGNI